MLRERRTEAAYDTFFCEVVAAAADPGIFADGRWSVTPDSAALHTIHHLGGGNFVVGGDVQQEKPPDR